MHKNLVLVAFICGFVILTGLFNLLVIAALPFGVGLKEAFYTI